MRVPPMIELSNVSKSFWTGTRRKVILDRLRTWSPFSNSSPVEGIDAAIRTFYAPDKKISLFVFGDEFSGNAIQPVIEKVFPALESESVRSRMPGSVAIGTCTASSKVRYS